MTESTVCMELIERARQGCEQSRGQLFDQYRKYLKTLARVHVLHDLQGKADPSDIVQETFLRAHEAFGQFRGTSERELIAWLRSIMASRLAKLVRHYFGTQSREAGLEVRLEQALDNSSCNIDRALAVSGITPSEIVNQGEQMVLLANAIEDLPSDYRSVILLRHLQGLSHKEVSAKMNRSVDSVKKLWVRALVQLRNAMESN